MALEITSEKIICPRCGMAFSKRRGNFSVCYAAMYKGSGFIPYCKDCLDAMFQNYLGQCGKADLAVRQICRKLDLYWNPDIFEAAFKKSTNRSVIGNYIVRINTAANAGKCYDNTLIEEDTLWTFGRMQGSEATDDEDDDAQEIDTTEIQDVYEKKITRRMVKFWGSVYSPEVILQLEERYKYWMSRLPDDVEIDIGTEVLLKQISALDIDINNCRMGDGKNIDKLIAQQRNLLQDLNLKPVQRKKDDGDSLNEVPFGVGIAWCEKKRPIAEPSEDLRDVDRLRKYTLTWVFGHLVKMVGEKNRNSRLYDAEMAKWRVERPEFNDEDDENFIADALSSQDEEV